MVYFVTLTSVGDPVYKQNPYTPLFGVPQKRICAASIEECQNIVRDYIDEYNLGAGNWTGGDVYDELGHILGYISYNGRYWPKEGLK